MKNETRVKLLEAQTAIDEAHKAALIEAIEATPELRAHIIALVSGNTLTPTELAELDNWFSYHAGTPELIEKYNHVRESSKALATYIMENVPRSADRTAALRSLRNTTMAINLAIACNE